MLKEHPRHHGYYFSQDGFAFRLLKNGRYRRLIGCACGIGYRAISVPCPGGRPIRVYIHRAVCEIFHGPPPSDGMHCRHLDGNMHNNASTNLAWGTPRENADDQIKHGKTSKGEKNGMAVLNFRDVGKMRQLRSSTGMYYWQIADMFGVSTMTAHRAITGRSWA